MIVKFEALHADAIFRESTVRNSPHLPWQTGLTGLVQSMARELQPRNIHVAHVVIDGWITTRSTPSVSPCGPDACLDPDAIAETYLQLLSGEGELWD